MALFTQISYRPLFLSSKFTMSNLKGMFYNCHIFDNLSKIGIFYQFYANFISETI